ncbi:hypothetical protein MesoLjLc_29070 [Mesorhizobium sp. L-8-10]|uniref:hypothetical protein n=1 Tax=unclassified Mesorhizobium TaxID=325217 RepID=UPI001928FB56|nr:MULTISPECIES: hypothetical protein [unclassified Mesorhizobium]BCH23169.1 hypothetical protein MesoLjLb_29540 [Mesorhizobium sp. L-8-3]BCH30977.1 hypothetical protein MesoLjLc_29070 [Mesorhizobium sp. L-8-10]
MIRQPHTAAREVIVAKAIEEVASELRLVEVVDYVAYVRLEHFSTIADIVESAAELYFLPGTLSFGHGGEVRLGWSGEPEILLDMQLRPEGATVYFTLKLTDRQAAVVVNYVSFDQSCDDPAENTRLLEAALDAARLRKASPSGAAQDTLSAG